MEKISGPCLKNQQLKVYLIKSTSNHADPKGNYLNLQITKSNISKPRLHLVILNSETI